MASARASQIVHPRTRQSSTASRNDATASSFPSACIDANPWFSAWMASNTMPEPSERRDRGRRPDNSAVWSYAPRATESVPVAPASRARATASARVAAAPLTSPDPSAARADEERPDRFDESLATRARRRGARLCRLADPSPGSPLEEHLRRRPGRPRASPSALPTVRALDEMTPDAARRRVGRPNAGSPVHPRPSPVTARGPSGSPGRTRHDRCRRPFGFFRRARRGRGERLDQQRVRLGVAIPAATAIGRASRMIAMASACSPQVRSGLVPERAKQRRSRTRSPSPSTSCFRLSIPIAELLPPIVLSM